MKRERFETTMTLTVDDDEQDCPVRALIRVDRFGATVESDIEALIDGRWIDLDMLHLDAGDAQHAAEALCDLGNEARSDLDPDEYEARR